MKRIIDLPHRMDDYACMWNGIIGIEGNQIELTE